MPNTRPSTMNIHISIDSDNDVIDIEMEHDIDDGMAEDKAEFFMDLLNGIGFKIDAEAESIAFQGALLRKVSELQELLEEYEEGVVDFEPDDQLLDKIKEAKSNNVVSLKSKLH